MMSKNLIRSMVARSTQQYFMSQSRTLQSFTPVMLSKAASAKKTSSPLGLLRKKSGYSLTLCKKALEANDQDVNKAYKWLQVQK